MTVLTLSTVSWQVNPVSQTENHANNKRVALGWHNVYVCTRVNADSELAKVVTDRSSDLAEDLGGSLGMKCRRIRVSE